MKSKTGCAWFLSGRPKELSSPFLTARITNWLVNSAPSATAGAKTYGSNPKIPHLISFGSNLMTTDSPAAKFPPRGWTGCIPGSARTCHQIITRPGQRAPTRKLFLRIFVPSGQLACSRLVRRPAASACGIAFAFRDLMRPAKGLVLEADKQPCVPLGNTSHHQARLASAPELVDNHTLHKI